MAQARRYGGNRKIIQALGRQAWQAELFKGRTAIVTGGARGIGLACAAKITAGGGRVALWDRDLDARRAVGRRAEGRHRRLGRCDQRRRRSPRRWPRPRSELAPPDILVASAGITGPNTTVVAYPVDAWRQVIDINLTGVFLCNRAVADGMAQARLGPHRQHRLGGRQGRQPQRLGLLRLQGRRHRPHQVARQGTCDDRRAGELRGAGGGEDGAVQPDDRAAHQLHAVEDPDEPLRRGRRSGRDGRVARLQPLHLRDRRDLRSLRRAATIGATY